MVLKCGACGEKLEIEFDIPNGTHVLCPYCETKTTYRESSSTTCPIETDGKLELLKQDVGDFGRNNARPLQGAHGAQQLHGHQSTVPRCAHALRKPLLTGVAEGGESSGFSIWLAVSLFAVAVVIGLVMYSRHSRLQMQDELSHTVSAQSDSVEPERVHKDVEDREQESASRREAVWRREREERKKSEEVEREKKRVAREKELQSQREKTEKEKENRERVAEVERQFKVASIVFASDFPVDKSPLMRDGCFFAIEVGYVADRCIYEVMVEKGSVSAVRMFSINASPVDIDVGEFSGTVLRRRFLAKDKDGIVWICGTGKSSWTEKVSLSSDEIVPSKIELEGLKNILSSWGRLPDLKYRLTLKAVKRGGSMPLGIIRYDDSVSLDVIRDVVLKQLQKRREQSANIAPPKLEKYKPTILLYEGNIIRHEMNGVTRVPRNWCNDVKWQQLKAEAERQERRQEETIRRNAQLMQEYDMRVRTILGKGISGEEIEAELGKYQLLIERSRSKLPL